MRGRVSLVALMLFITLVRVAAAQTEKPLASVVAELRTLDGAVKGHHRRCVAAHSRKEVGPQARKMASSA